MVTIHIHTHIYIHRGKETSKREPRWCGNIIPPSQVTVYLKQPSKLAAGVRMFDCSYGCNTFGIFFQSFIYAACLFEILVKKSQTAHLTLKHRSDISPSGSGVSSPDPCGKGALHRGSFHGATLMMRAANSIFLLAFLLGKIHILG